MNVACFVQSCLTDADFVLFSNYCLIGTRLSLSLLLQSDKKQISPKEKFIIAKQQDSDRKPHEKYMKMMQMRQKMWESVWMKNKEMRY